MEQVRKSIHGVWGSRWIFILAATGSAVGLGNIWKFPYITGENGGGAFVLVYLVCIALIGIPIMMAEVLIGKHGRQSPINAMRDVARVSSASKSWVLLGWLGAIAGFLILSYYSVIAGWALAYILRLGGGDYENATAETINDSFSQLQADPGEMIIWHSLFMLFTIIIVAHGVQRGLERAVRFLMPMLFLLLLILLGYALSIGSFSEGLEFLFKFNFDKLTWEGALTAMGHAFFTLSLGMGAIMVYGAYMPEKAPIGNTVLTIGILDTVVALVAGMAIFPIVIANGLQFNAGPGLIFQTLPIAFSQLPGGQIFGALFFILVSFAAWSSAISLIEPAVAWAVERFNVKRAVITAIFGVFAWLLGTATVFSFNIWKDVKLLGFNIFEGLDFLTANIMLPLGGMFIAIFVGWVMQRDIVKNEINLSSKAFISWDFVVKVIAPLAVFIVFSLAIYKQFFGG